jgi:hypothetical protein
MTPTLTPDQWFLIATIAANFGTAVALKILDIAEQLAAGKPVSREDMIGALKPLDYAAKVPNSLALNPIKPPQ